MKIVLTQPNYAWFNKRVWAMPPYTLALLNACLKSDHDVQLFDPNYNNLTEEEVFNYFNKVKPEVVGVSSISTEYIKANKLMNSIIKKAVPDSILIQGGIIPTVVPEIATKDPNVDYWILGEGEYRFPSLLNELKKSKQNFSSLDGLAYKKNGIIKLKKPKGFIQDLDSLPFSDYGNLDLLDYGNKALRYSPQLLPRKFPYAVTITSRGCPYECIFCASSTVSGRKIRFRSAENVLEEIDTLYRAGIREIIFLDDHFLGNRKRAVKIMQGLVKRKYDLTWKCVNMTVFLLNDKILELMRESGCYQITLSIESGNQYVLNKIIKKAVKLNKIHGVLNKAKSLGFEILANFVIGFPGETWEQIRETFRFAETINVDMANFHLATPLPKTELMEICLREGYLPKDFNIKESLNSGYAKGLISTSEFTPSELEILRAFEWDRINFSKAERRKAIARIEGISLKEMKEWRMKTRQKFGINVVL